MADIWPAIPLQRAICLDDRGRLITIRQEDGEGNENCIDVQKVNIDRLIECLQKIRG